MKFHIMIERAKTPGLCYTLQGKNTFLALVPNTIFSHMKVISQFVYGQYDDLDMQVLGISFLKFVFEVLVYFFFLFS